MSGLFLSFFVFFSVVQLKDVTKQDPHPLSLSLNSAEHVSNNKIVLCFFIFYIVCY